MVDGGILAPREIDSIQPDPRGMATATHWVMQDFLLNDKGPYELL